jgi:hypothetical protein
MYVTTCSVTFQLRPQTVPDSEHPSEKRGLNCGERRDRYTGPPRGNTKELGYPCLEGHGKRRGSRPSHTIENTLFRDVFSNPLYLDQVAQTVVTKTDVVKMQTTTLPNKKW